MKYLKRIIPGCLFLLAAVAVLTVPVMAQESFSQQPEPSPEKLEYIRRNCTSAQTAIQRVQQSDVVTRTNRGRSYEQLLNLMAALNSRIALTKNSEPRMVELTSQMQSEFREFYQHYTDYRTIQEQTLAMRCQDDPAGFYESLVSMREKRAQLTTDVVKIRQHIDEYNQLATDLQQRLDSQPRSTGE